MGDVNRDLNTRRGRVLGMDTDGDGNQVVSAHVPQAELFTYATELRSLTHGRGTFTATLDHYEEVPSHIADKVVAAHRKDVEAGSGRTDRTGEPGGRPVRPRSTASIAASEVETALVECAADDRRRRSRGLGRPRGRRPTRCRPRR